ncbi:MAG: hypothetical protein LBU58_07540 [Clostridiales bacterium]|nr:hypothetical protein [Clostridiales bacterium]
MSVVRREESEGTIGCPPRSERTASDACEESQFINGSSIRADGGVMLVAP